jgi:predicted acylesterase/phospholipase RssA
MARQGKSTSTAGAKQDPLKHLLEVGGWKLFPNLSWRLLALLVKDITVERRVVGKGDSLAINVGKDGKDFVCAEQGDFVEVTLTEKKTSPEGALHAAMLESHPAERTEEALPQYRYFPVKKGGSYKATRDSVAYIFNKNKKTQDPDHASNWAWLTLRSVVARRALLEDQGLTTDLAEVVLLTSKDLVEYLPALTDLLAQAMAAGDKYETPQLRVRCVRFDPGAITPRDAAPFPDDGTPRPRQILPVSDANALAGSIEAAREGCDYVFVDPYDRASDLAATQVKTLVTRARVSDPGSGVDQDLPGTTLTVPQFTAMRDKVDSIVHVARSFRLEAPDTDKLNFYAVALDSRTARFESGGPREWKELRNADDPLRQQIEPPKKAHYPTTRLHLNLLRMKKAWERSPDLHDVCHMLDEPNIPRVGEQGGFWKAKSFFERWVRDLQFRRIGIALGGGGATGFCHVALLRKLREENIPIDLVSGTSFGALVGAYYCSHGLDGLETLKEQALLLTGVASLTVLTSAFFEHLVNLSIDYRPMWELPIPLYAVATNIETGDMEVFPGPVAANPSVGFAVRASGSLPGLFAPAIAGDLRPVRYVDGGAVSIVPAVALLQAGADVVIGSNAFPFRKADASYRATPLRGILPPPFGRFAERILAELNPGNRMIDAARSLSLSLTDAMQDEIGIASAVYEHKRTDVKYWEFHRAAQVVRETLADLVTSGALPAALDAVRLLNTPGP